MKRIPWLMAQILLTSSYSLLMAQTIEADKNKMAGTEQLTAVSARAQQEIDKRPASSPSKPEKLSKEQRSLNDEIRFGATLSKALDSQHKLNGNLAVHEYIFRLSNSINQPSGSLPPLNVKIIDDDTPHIYGIPGGHLYLTTGLIKTMASEEELAAAIAPNLARINLRNGFKEQQLIQRAYNWAVPLYVIPPFFVPSLHDKFANALAYSSYKNLFLNDLRREYMEGARYMADAGYNPQAVSSVAHKRVEQSQPNFHEKTNKDWLNIVDSAVANLKSTPTLAGSARHDDGRFEQIKSMLSRQSPNYTEP